MYVNWEVCLKKVLKIFIYCLFIAYFNVFDFMGLCSICYFYYRNVNNFKYVFYFLKYIYVQNYFNGLIYIKSENGYFFVNIICDV